LQLISVKRRKIDTPWRIPISFMFNLMRLHELLIGKVGRVHEEGLKSPVSVPAYKHV
jgi:hypothetical protein